MGLARLGLPVFRFVKDSPFGRKVYSRLLGLYIPYAGTLDCEVMELEPGRVTVKMTDRGMLRGHLDCLDGAALANLGEFATALAIHSNLPVEGRAILTRIAAEFHRKARGSITATCRVGERPTPGRHDLDAMAELSNAEGVVVATVRACWRVES